MHALYMRLALSVIPTSLGMIPASLAGYVSYNAATYAPRVDVQAVVIAVIVDFEKRAGADAAGRPKGARPLPLGQN